MSNELDSWEKFKSILVEDILPIYQLNEQLFDSSAIHGRKHIIRSLLFAEVMSNYYKTNFSIDLDLMMIRMAISFHDAGRKANGPDFWEAESSKICFNYLVMKGFSETYSSKISDTIIKSSNLSDSLEVQIIQDADVIEILRLFVGFDLGLNEFREDELSFISNKSPLVSEFQEIHFYDRKVLLKEAWNFINETDGIFPLVNNLSELEQILFYLTTNPEKYVFLNKWLFNS